MYKLHGYFGADSSKYFEFGENVHEEATRKVTFNMCNKQSDWHLMENIEIPKRRARNFKENKRTGKEAE